MPLRNRINRDAQGFLSLFRAKVGGQGPLTLREDVQPVVEVRPFLATGVLAAAQDTSAAASPPTNMNIQVPAGEIWMIHSITLSMWAATGFSSGVGVVWAIQIQGLQNSSGTVVDAQVALAEHQQSFGTNVHAGWGAVWQPPTEMMLKSGTNIQGQYITDNTTANYEGQLDVIYTRLED